MDGRILVDRYFDGERRHAHGPYAIVVVDGSIARIESHPDTAPSLGDEPVAAFAMPGLVEAHAHVFLDGAVLDLEARALAMKQPLDVMLETGRRNLRDSVACGVTLIRDAGDRFGVNDAMREEARGRPSALPQVRSPGVGIRRPKRYGAFMAHEATSRDEIQAVIARIHESGARDLKIIQTGIIDFGKGDVAGDPQFDAEALAIVVREAHARGLRTFAHCSGASGVRLAVEAGVESIEHGFFVEDDTLKLMADRGTAWVPTVSPVHFQSARPEIVGWDETARSNLRRIVDRHLQDIGRAHDLGVCLMAGSDAGSHGVPHGAALLDELFFFLEAGVPLESTLASATSSPRRRWDEGSPRLEAGSPADIVLLKGDPFHDPGALRDIKGVYLRGVPALRREPVCGPAHE